ncbi:N-acetylmuramoyl-L-alanine amidase [Alishewanella longhuensis]
MGVIVGRATSEVGRMLEQTERHSELLGGVAEVIKDSANERYLAQTVLDLSMNHSMVTAHQVANQVLSELGKVTTLHKREPQAASLGVLRSPDIPSILVEVGFISG